MTDFSQSARIKAMSCTIRVRPHEKIETTIERWNKILDLLKEEKNLAQQRKKLKGYQTDAKDKLKEKMKNTRSGENEAIKLARKALYNPLDKFLLYLHEEWDMAFETYQVLEFIFRASMYAHERKLFDYGPNQYAEELKDLKGTPAEKYKKILSLTSKFSRVGIFGLDDLYPTKMEYVNDVNRDLREQIRHIQSIQGQLEKINVEGSPLQKIANDLKRASSGLEGWALGRVLGEEQNRGFLSFRDGEIIMDHKNFLYFKIYILVFMGTFGEFANRVYPERFSKVCQLAEKKLKFESEKHFDFKITPRFLSGRERFANQDRNAENIPMDRGFLDDELLTYIVERNDELYKDELPFYLLKDFSHKKTA